MIRVVVVDDHPALRAGLETVLRSEPGIVPVGTASTGEELWPLLHRSRPDVVLLDYHLPGDDGLLLCRRIKRRLLAPRVLLYSAYAGGSLAVPAELAGADGVLGKGVPAHELCEAIRRVYRGDRVAPPLRGELLEDASSRVDQEDLPILGMLLDQTSEPDMAAVLGIPDERLHGRIDAIIRRLRVEVPDLEL